MRREFLCDVSVTLFVVMTWSLWSIEDDEEDGGGDDDEDDIDFVSDALLKKNAFVGFDVAGPSVDEEMKSWKLEYDSLNKA